MAKRLETSAPPSMLDVVHAAYRVELDVESWLKGLVDAAHPVLDRGYGVMAWSFEVHAGSHVFGSPIATSEGITPAIIEACVDNNASLSPEEVALAYGGASTLDTASRVLELLGGSFAEWPKFHAARAMGIADCMVAKGFDPAGLGFVFAVPLPEIDRTPSGNARLWFKTMAHVLAALRLRTGLRIGDDDAVIEPGGRVVHAEAAARSASAREALRDAAITVDRARARRGRADPDAALARWKGLVAGRWSLVDRFESDGRRYLIARPNCPDIDGPPRLTERERQVVGYAAMGHTNQHIAYALGRAPSTVSTHLRRAMRHLGVKRRADLAALRVPPPRQ